MTILDDYKPYIDKYGLVQDKPGNTSGNGIRYTAEAMYAVLISRNWESQSGVFVHDAFQSILYCSSFGLRTETRFYLKRHPDGEPTTIDDYTAAIFASWAIGETVGLTRHFLAAGPKQNYIYAPDFDPKFFLGRFPQLFCIANWVAKRKPSKFQELFWMISVFQGAIHKGQDEKVLSWMLVEIGRGRRWIFKPLIWFWRKKLKKHYPYGIGQVLSDYYGNPDHPNAKYLKGVGV